MCHRVLSRIAQGFAEHNSEGAMSDDPVFLAENATNAHNLGPSNYKIT